MTPIATRLLPFLFLFSIQNCIAQVKEAGAPTASLTVSVSADFDCNNLIDENEFRVTSFTATLQQAGYSNVLAADKQGIVIFNDLKAGSYSLVISFSARKQNFSQTFSVTVGNGVSSNYRAIVNNHCKEDKPKDTVEIVIKPRCGDWVDSEIGVSNFNLTKGDRDIRSREVITARLKEKFSFDLNYSIRYRQNNKDVSEKCMISYKVRYPDGAVSNSKNGFSLNILQPGLYTIDYTVNCNGNNCVSGVKYIRCDEQIVCNCGTPNNILNISEKGSKNTNLVITTNDSIIFNKAVKTWIRHTTYCEGNICDGSSSYVIKDASGRIVNSGNFNGRFNPNLPVGNNYQLLVTDFCGIKNCNKYTYNLAITENRVIVQRAKIRVGIHGDVHLNTPKFTNLSSNRATVNGMLGLIADFGLGTQQQFHLWPSLNYTWYRYSGEKGTGGAADFKARYATGAFELGLDASYELVRKNESALHIYIGGAIDFEKTRKEKLTGSATAINSWKLANASTDSMGLNFKTSLGLLYEINYKWMLGLNYYTYNISQRKDQLIRGKNNGVALRLAYFFNRRK